MKSTQFLAAVTMLAFAPVGQAETPKQLPNVLLILADDLGFSDLGCYGGEIETPHLDGLARHGLRFTQFYNTARCWPTRGSILTGYYAQQIRRDTVPDVLSGSRGTRPAWARLVPELLQTYGYLSYHSGKWHIDGQPLKNGFARSYSLNDHDRHFAPRQHALDDKPLPAADPKTGYYSSTAIADHAIAQLAEHFEKQVDRPFFSFVAFTAPHFPVQAPASDIAKYRKKYLDGWDKLRDQRWQRMKELRLGVALPPIERDLGPPYPFPEALKKLGPNEVNRPVPWQELTAEQQAFQADKMAVHAAMVDRMDREIGRIVDAVKKAKALENTLILFLSDNGASAEIMVRGDGHDPHADCGTGATFLSIGPGWSSLCNTPYRRHKTWVHEGGIHTPLIAHWPHGIAARGELRSTPGHVVDFVPTVLELVTGQRVRKPATPDAPPFAGRSLVPAFAKDTTIERASIWWQHEGNRALRVGNWKIVAAGTPGDWELYDLATDPTETKNLAKVQPGKRDELASAWQKQTDEIVQLARRDAPPAPKKKNRPNVLFVAVDDLRPAIAAAGDAFAKTPNLDRLAARGTVFTRAYCQQALCSPSRSSLLTGRRPDSTKVYDLTTHFRTSLPDVITLPQHFKENGYYVHAVGKIYHPGYNDERSWSVPWEATKGRAFGPDGQKLLAKLKADAKDKGNDAARVRGLPTEAPDVADDYLNDGWTAKRALEILKDRKEKTEPFFLAVGFAKPHLPFVAPKKYWDLYNAAQLPLAAERDPLKNAPRFAPNLGGELRAYHEIAKSGPLPLETQRRLVHGYYAAVSYMDAQLGRLLDGLKELGLEQDTVVIVWGDHGWHLGDHGMWCKHTNYEQATRAALIMSAPGQRTVGQSSGALVEFVDVYPTLTELCGLPKPANVEGHSFAPLMADPRKKWKLAAFSQYPRGNKDFGPMMGYAVRTERYRYVEWRKRDGTEVVARELYDYSVDPNESTNVSDDPSYLAAIDELAKRIASGWKANAPPK